MKRIAIIIGTRPEAIKMLPVYLAASVNGDLQPILISTGQHREMVYDVLDLFQCKLDHDLKVMESGQSLSSLTSKIFSHLDDVLDDAIDLVLVQGDTTTAMVGAMLSFYKGISCAHVEAGLRSGDLQSPFPEEYNRRVISMSASLHFAPTEAAAENLRREGVSHGLHVVGNTSIDAAFMITAASPEPSAQLLSALPSLADHARRMILVTAHRRENFGDRIGQIIAAVTAIAVANPDIDIIWPVHPNPKVRDVIYRLVPDRPNVFLTKPVRYDDLIQLVRRSYIILTDSGGIQEEAPAFNTPVIVMRDTTERPEGVEVGCSVLTGTETEKILYHFNRIHKDAEIYQKMCKAENPYGDGAASQRIVDVISTAG